MMGELNDTAMLERKRGNPRPKNNLKGNSPGRDGHKRLPDYHGVVDVLAAMQWRMDNPQEEAVTPIQKAVTRFFLKEFESFVAQYAELRSAKANEDLAKAQRENPTRVVTASGEEPLEVSETDLKIDEAIDRVIQQLEEFGDGEDRHGTA